ncbi:Rrf2 family transcriptional regulator [Caproiciproducens sp. NJN-50]|uniref:RrF2 family transcriptional regulator n=1 Tax=Acutalibacteraceae TaxID=3082771 RepID=UPI000FFE1BAA|nr:MULTISPECIES: Rrf2 family transcriptional regulator [Acutalibacteraceae]QAT49816.1 Rrf2 family transcriptional regulator [Caproiciproducens sp. NJN-50]
MLITRETDYAIRILRALAGETQITTAEICKKELLPQQFAYKILKKLQKSGLVSVTRGKDGGCRLIGDLRKVSLYDLMEITDSDKSVSACTQPGFPCAWRQKYGKPCKVHQHLQRLQDRLDQELKAVLLSEILSDCD